MDYSKRANKILANYRKDSQDELEKRIRFIEENIPEYLDINKKINALGMKMVKLSINLEENKELIEDYKEKINFYEDRKEKLLIENNLEKDYLTINHRCNKCEDTGSYNGALCDCKRNIIRKLSYKVSELDERLIIDNFDNFDFSLFSKEEIEDRGYSPYDTVKITYDHVLEYCNNFTGKGDKSIIFTGDVGVGKTYFCSCIAKCLLDKGKSVVYQSAPTMMKTLWDYYYASFEDRDNERVKFNSFMESDLLIIDDLGTEKMNDTNLSYFFELLNQRIVKQKPMIISTNMGLSDIRRYYDERIYSRILGEFEVFPIQGEDLRLKKKGY